MQPPRSWQVFVPSRGSVDAVERVHRQIAAQLPPDCVTIILNPPAQNSLDSDVPRRCRALGMTPVVCVGGGVSRARNTALALASQELLVFLDDDVTATADAVRCLVDGLRRTEACVATGRVVCRPSGSTTDELWRTDLALDRGAAPGFWTSRSGAFISPFDVWQFGVGAAFATDLQRMRQVLDRDVTFDERLSNGRFAGGTEDADYFYSVYVAGGGIAYVADAVFEHDFPASAHGLRAKCRQYAISDGAFYAKWRSRAHSSDLVAEIHGWCARVARYIHARARRQPAVPLGSLLAEPVYKAVGALAWQLR